ncbi:sensor histidine kinase [Runella slithyformis]|uniref:histidine kinase n=1 Tax=Runella slithyformis (strain ATCC 29530 / DSM 19594 / LMG 11500 / NCIMB 11436 / LSU 4) TaxID=761193 RepID=A0A7U3ZFX7_RUNSL|nr:HAMP domain-containing sensor histidine kinase [Runella slithyformis]AEI46489.1 integral membrane sensor signal transduction histidine kinase [Runella slithyformis DSM 19594]
MQIRTKLTGQFALLVSAIMLMAFVTIYFIRMAYVEREFYKRLRHKAITTCELLVKVEGVDSKLLRQIDKTNYDVLYNENLTIYDHTNEELYTSNENLYYTVSPELLDRIRLEKEVQFSEGNAKIIGILYTDRFNRVVCIAGAEDKYGNDELNSLLRILTGMYFGVIGLVIAAGWYFAGQAMKPVSHAIEQVNQIYPKLIDRRLTVQNPRDEVGRLTSTFNKLLDRIGEVFRLQNLFISNVSHELKNPLMRVGAQLDVALLKDRTEAEYRQTLLSVREDIRDLGQLSETLLELAKVNDQTRSLIYNDVRIDEIVWEARDLLLKAEPSYEVQVHFLSTIEDDNQLIVKANPHLMKTAIVNLMENGCKFSPNLQVVVDVFPLKNNVEIRFTNTGIVIAPKDIPYIFQPFFRSDNTANIKGYGVGLSLVERIAKLHDGSIKVTSSIDAQTTFFSLILPYRH